MTESKKILVVDDARVARLHVGCALAKAGYHVVEAGDGLEASTKLAEDRTIALVLCDLNMPHASGFELLEAMERESSTGALKVPVVVLTTEGSPKLISRARALGAKGWILKPPNPDRLVEVVRRLTDANRVDADGGPRVGRPSCSP